MFSSSVIDLLVILVFYSIPPDSILKEDRHANPTERWDEYVLELNSDRSVHGLYQVLSFLPFEHCKIN
jgi:hypothetical protein